MSEQLTGTKKEVRPGTDRELRIHDGIVGALILLSVVMVFAVRSGGCFYDQQYHYRILSGSFYSE